MSWVFCKCEHSQSMLKLSNVSHTASVQGVLPGTCTGSGFGVLGLGCQHLVLERRLSVCSFCLKCSKQAVVRNDSPMIPGWHKTSKFVFTYLDISTGLQVMSTWDCSFSSLLQCLQNLIFINHGVMLCHCQGRMVCGKLAH